MSEFHKLDQFMRTHVPVAAAAGPARRRPVASLAWAGVVTATLCLGLLQYHRTQVAEQELAASLAVLEWDLAQEDAMSELTDLVALVD